MSQSLDHNAKDFLSLLTKYDRQTFSYILALVPNWADAEEIAQEVRIRLWEQFAGTFQPGSDFGAWSRGVAYYQVLTFRKKTSKRPAGLSQEFLESIQAEVADSADELTDREAALQQCLGRLSESQRAMLREHYAGKTLQAVAEEVGRSFEMVKKTMYRARMFLTECIERAMHRMEEN